MLIFGSSTLLKSNPPHSVPVQTLGITVPLRFKGGYYHVPVSVGGEKPQWYVLDTGCSVSLLTGKGYARLAKAGFKAGTDGSLSVSGVQIGEVAVGDLKMKRDSTVFKRSADAHADGQIGLDALAGFRVGLDLAKGEMRLWSKTIPIEAVRAEWFGTDGSAVASAGLYPLVNGDYQTYVVMNGFPLLLSFDTGSDTTYLNKACQSAMGSMRKVGSYSVEFYDGDRQVDQYEAHGVWIGGRPLSGRLTYGVTDAELGEGMIGHDVMRRLRLLLDYPGEHMYASGLGAGDAPVFSVPPLATLAPYSFVIYTPDGPLVMPPGDYAMLMLPKGSTSELISGGASVFVLPGAKRPGEKGESKGD